MNTILEEGKAISKEIAKIEIEKPSAFPGDKVVFYNPRTKGGELTGGKVVHLETSWGDGGINIEHTYVVKPDSRNYTVRIRQIYYNESRRQQEQQCCQCGKPVDSRYAPCCSLECWHKEFS